MAKERDRYLTPREAEIVELIAEGYLDKEIAKELGIQLGTVKALVSDALHRTGSVNRVQLAVRWVKGEV